VTNGLTDTGTETVESLTDPNVAIDGAAATIAMVDTNGQMFDCNERLQELLRYSIDALVEKPLSETCVRGTGSQSSHNAIGRCAPRRNRDKDDGQPDLK